MWCNHMAAIQVKPRYSQPRDSSDPMLVLLPNSLSCWLDYGRLYDDEPEKDASWSIPLLWILEVSNQAEWARPAKSDVLIEAGGDGWDNHSDVKSGRMKPVKIQRHFTRGFEACRNDTRRSWTRFESISVETDR